MKTRMVYRTSERINVRNQSETARILNIPRSTWAQYVRGERKPDAYACLRMAQILDLTPLYVTASVEADHAKTEERKNYWLALEDLAARSGLTYTYWRALWDSTTLL